MRPFFLCSIMPCINPVIFVDIYKKLFQRRVTPLKSGAQAERSEDLPRRRCDVRFATSHHYPVRVRGHPFASEGDLSATQVFAFAKTGSRAPSPTQTQFARGPIPRDDDVLENLVKNAGHLPRAFPLPLTLTPITNTYTLTTSSLPKRRFQPWMRRSYRLRPKVQRNQTVQHSCHPNLPHLFQH